MNTEFCGILTESSPLTAALRATETLSIGGGTRVNHLSEEDGEVFLVELKEPLFMNDDLKSEATEKLEKCLKLFFKKYKIRKNSLVLAVGVGNDGMTADALGAKSLKYMEITEHLHQAGLKPSGKGRLSAVCGSVSGVTGLNSYDIIRGVVDRVKPDIVVAIDTLASRKAVRLQRVIQVSDKGLVPGSGVENARAPLNEESLGVPVIAIGVPLVIYARNLLADYLADYKLSDLTCGKDNGYRRAEEELKELVVTVKEIDVSVEDFARVIGNAVSAAVHE